MRKSKRLFIVFLLVTPLLIVLLSLYFVFLFADSQEEYLGRQVEFPADSAEAILFYKDHVEERTKGIKKIHAYIDNTGADRRYLIKFQCGSHRFRVIKDLSRYEQISPRGIRFTRLLYAPEWFDLPDKLGSNPRSRIEVYRRKIAPSKVEFLAYDFADRSGYYFVQDW